MADPKHRRSKDDTDETPSDAGGYADVCRHAGCTLEVWACCTVCHLQLCHQHFGESPCHMHGAQHAYCCPTCWTPGSESSGTMMAKAPHGSKGGLVKLLQRSLRAMMREKTQQSPDTGTSSESTSPTTAGVAERESLETTTSITSAKVHYFVESQNTNFTERDDEQCEANIMCGTQEVEEAD